MSLFILNMFNRVTPNNPRIDSSQRISRLSCGSWRLLALMWSQSFLTTWGRESWGVRVSFMLIVEETTYSLYSGEFSQGRTALRYDMLLVTTTVSTHLRANSFWNPPFFFGVPSSLFSAAAFLFFLGFFTGLLATSSSSSSSLS